MRVEKAKDRNIRETYWEIKELFINSKGGNIKYDYKDRREGEAQIFTK